MKKIALVVGLLALLGSPARADHTDPFGNYGSFCSAHASDGRWGVWFGTDSVQVSCAIVRRNLALTSFGAITYLNRGYYNVYGWNQVDVVCDTYRNRFTGYGIDPADRAFRSAQWSGASFCRFGVWAR
jgi:hypothetical protein